jgi:hypothetical protein
MKTHCENSKTLNVIEWKNYITRHFENIVKEALKKLERLQMPICHGKKLKYKERKQTLFLEMRLATYKKY